MANKHAKRSAVHGNAPIGMALAAVVVGMVGMAYAAEPAYRLFCKVTGYGGTTQRVERAPAVEDAAGRRMITVHFDANVNAALPWRFRPVQRQVKLRLGVEKLIFYEATNLSDRTIVGTATFNVAPFKAGAYFNKIECFCFTEQVLAPGQTVTLPVSFFIDPEMTDDKHAGDIESITLSYTFFRARDQSAAVKAGAAAKAVEETAGAQAPPINQGHDG